MSFFKQLFSNTKPVKKAFKTPNYKTVGNLNASWYRFNDKGDYLAAFNDCPPVSAIINYKADAFSKLEYKLYDKAGKVVESHPLLDRLQQPNPLQSEKEFLKQLYKTFQIFGNSFTYASTPAGFALTPDTDFRLYNLPVQNLLIKQFPFTYSITEVSEVVEYYAVKVGNTGYRFEPEYVLQVNEPSQNFDVDGYVWGQSKLKSLAKPISNIIAAYEARNVILRKRGAVGILTNTDRDAAGKIPLTPDEIEQLQNDFQKYGLSDDQWQILITDAGLSWIPITWPIADLALDEGIRSDTIAIANGLNFPAMLLNNEQSTFDNMNQSQKLLYENSIIPDAKIFERAFNEFLGISEAGMWLEFDYSHVQAMQEDEQVRAATNATRAQTIINIATAVQNGVLTSDQARNVLSMFGYTDVNLIL